MPEVVAQYKIEVDGAVKNLNRVSSAAEKTGTTIQDSFLKGSNGAKRFEKELNKTPKTVAELTLKLSKLKELLRDDTKIGTEGFRKVTAEIRKTSAALDKTNAKLKETGNQSKSLMGTFKKLAGVLGVTFATAQVVRFGKEAVDLAAKAEGIKTAFDKLNNPSLLDDLRVATRGTVTDIRLMQQAVKANNFKIPLDQLAKFFQFATNRSIETGESVDDLTNRIVTGIGRKSVRVLDDLGFSLQELQNEVRIVGDFGEAVGNIIDRELGKMGDVADTTTIRMDRLNASLDNTKIALGSALIASVDGATDAFVPLTNAIDDFVEAMAGAGIETSEYINEQNALIAVAEFVKGAIKAQLPAWLNLALGLLETKEAIQDFNKESEEAATLIENLGKSLFELELERRAKEGSKLFDKEDIQNLKFYNDLISALQTKQKSANVTRKEVRDLENEINEAIRQRAILLGKIREVGGPEFESIDSAILSSGQLQIESQQTATDDILADWDRRNAAILEAQRRLNADLAAEQEIYEEEQRAIFMETFDVVSGIIGDLAQISANKGRVEIANLQEQLDQRLISEEEFSVKKKQILSQEAEDQKAYAIFQATINTAQAVVAALGSQPFTPANIALAAAVGVAGAVQIGLIASQASPQFAEGGWVDSKGLIHGRSHAQGGVNIEAEGDEFIVKGRHAKTNPRLLEAVNSGLGDKYIYENHVAPIIRNILKGGSGAMGDSLKLNSMFNDKNLIKLGDRNRGAARQDARYIVSELTKVMQPRKRGGYA